MDKFKYSNCSNKSRRSTMGDKAPPSLGGGSPMTASADKSSSSGGTKASKEEWEKLLARDVESMSRYERIEMEQDVQGKNLLASISPSVTVKMGLKSMRRELIRMHQENSTESQSQKLDQQQQSQTDADDSNDRASASVSEPSHASVTRSHSPTRVNQILKEDFIIQNEEILLQFLLADRLHAEKAAKRLVEYYAMAVELFGDAALTRPLLIGDLERQEQKLLESGWIQLLLTRDTSGRRIITVDEAGVADPANIIHKLKVFMYVFQVAAEDSDTQKQGLHLILHRLFNIDSVTGSVDEDAWMVDSNERQMFQRLFACAPIRCSIIHINTPTPDKWVWILPSVIQMFGKDERGRIRFHQGSIAACHQEMEAYGVPAEWMPMTSTGRRKLNEHKLWIKMQKGREIALQHGHDMEVVECPRPNDILLTKTRRASSHPGNQKLREILENRYEERYMAHPMKKQSITSQVADQLEEKLHARFLVKNKESFWVPADRTIVLDKLGNSFRFIPRLKPKHESAAPPSPEKDKAAALAKDVDSKPAAAKRPIEEKSESEDARPASSPMQQREKNDDLYTSRAMSPGPAPAASRPQD